MKEQKRSSFSPPALGGASLLVIFAVLALTIFALLSLSTVRADGRLSDAANQAIQDYYEADCKSQQYLALLRLGEDAANLEGLDDVDTVVIDYGGYTERREYFTFPISDTQELQVEVRVDGVNDYEILHWQAVPVGEWEADEGIDLWDMMF